MSNAWADWDFNTFTPILWWENSIFHLWYIHSTRHCTWPLSIWKRHFIMYRDITWWALCKLGIEEWLVLLIQSLYKNARSRVCFGCNLGEVLSVKVGVLQGFCLNPPSVSSQSWKPSPRSFIQDVPGKTCMKMTWTGASWASEVYLCCVSQGHWHKLHFLWWMFSWVHKKCSGIPGSGVNGVLDKLNQLMADQWQRSQRVGRSLRWCHPSVTSGTAYPKVVVVNSLPLQDAV